MMRRTVLWQFAICTAGLLAGCGDILTKEPEKGSRFDQPIEGLDNGELGDFQDGDIQFHRNFAISDGLGPIFNNVSCGACHSGDGRGSPTNILVRFSRGADLITGEGGPQIQDRFIPGAAPEALPGGVDVSRRLPPPVFGAGFIEAITDSTIASNEDPGDANGDGISGRVNRVYAPSYVPAEEPGGGAGLRVGRFGRKAQVSSLIQQAVDAYHQDMGITSPYRSTENVNPLAPPVPNLDRVNDPEVGTSEVHDVIQYMRMLAPPAPGEWNEVRRRGQSLFTSSGCASCHVPTMATGDHEIEALSHRTVTLYSDLLLHDLGPALADNRPDGDADGQEWRTAPLWGMRIVREFMGGTLILMHDGRARSIDEAIRLHGGEAAAARNAYTALSDSDRAALVEFVETR
jgi:CxxC motif-containing protein (DUF1111 family)